MQPLCKYQSKMSSSSLHKYANVIISLLSNEHATGSNFWSELESMLSQYHQLLEDREKLQTNISTLMTENDDLQSKLERNLRQDINSDLIVPPLKR